MRINEQIYYEGVKIISINEKTLKMRGSRYLDLAGTSVMDWAVDRKGIEERIRNDFSEIFKPKTIKFSDKLSTGQYGIGTTTDISGELQDDPEAAQKILDFLAEHRPKVGQKNEIEKQIEEVKKEAEYEIRELRKDPAYKYKDYGSHTFRRTT